MSPSGGTAGRESAENLGAQEPRGRLKGVRILFPRISRTSCIASAKIRYGVIPEWRQYVLERVVFSMPKGDAQRVWFPEMLAGLQRQWRDTMSFAALIDLCDSLDTMLQQIRSEKHISSLFSPVRNADSASPWLGRG
jgi:hypothetical protein